MKIIFLDVDGVLSLPSGSDLSLNKKRLRLLSELVKETDAKIVLSSTWRTDNKYYYRLQRHLSYRGMVIYSSTPILHCDRGIEIQSWMDSRSGFVIDKYIIIDDINTMLPSQHPYFLQTLFEIGLTQEIVQKGISILNSS